MKKTVTDKPSVINIGQGLNQQSDLDLSESGKSSQWRANLNSKIKIEAIEETPQGHKDSKITEISSKRR